MWHTFQANAISCKLNCTTQTKQQTHTAVLMCFTKYWQWLTLQQQQKGNFLFVFFPPSTLKHYQFSTNPLQSNNEKYKSFLFLFLFAPLDKSTSEEQTEFLNSKDNCHTNSPLPYSLCHAALNELSHAVKPLWSCVHNKMGLMSYGPLQKDQLALP